jgi:hypothetical protein
VEVTNVVLADRLAFEAWCLGRILNPMTNGGVSRLAKAVLLFLMGVWAVLVLDLTTAQPPSWLLISLTALLFAIVGRLWRIEADHWLSVLNPITINFGDDNE